MRVEMCYGGRKEVLVELAVDFNPCFCQVKIGLYVPHDPHVFQPIEWKHLVLNVARLGPQEMRKELEKHGRDMRMKVHTVT